MYNRVDPYGTMRNTKWNDYFSWPPGIFPCTNSPHFFSDFLRFFFLFLRTVSSGLVKNMMLDSENMAFVPSSALVLGLFSGCMTVLLSASYSSVARREYGSFGGYQLCPMMSQGGPDLGVMVQSSITTRPVYIWACSFWRGGRGTFKK